MTSSLFFWHLIVTRNNENALIPQKKKQGVFLLANAGSATSHA